MTQLLSLEDPRGCWVPLLLAVLLLQSVLTHGHPWPNQECPCQSRVEAHDENVNRAQLLEHPKMETLEKRQRTERMSSSSSGESGPLEAPMNQGLGLGQDPSV